MQNQQPQLFTWSNVVCQTTSGLGSTSHFDSFKQAGGSLMVTHDFYEMTQSAATGVSDWSLYHEVMMLNTTIIAMNWF